MKIKIKVNFFLFSKIMEYFFKEDVPRNKPSDGGVFWQQQSFPFASQSRVATVTDVVAHNDMLIVAHRAAAKLYLMEKHDGGYNIIDSLQLKINGSYYHPDLMGINDNLIYMTSYSNVCCVVEIDNKKLVYKTKFKIYNGNYFHGICVTNNKIYFGAQNQQKGNTFLTVHKLGNEKKYKNFYTTHKNRIKAISVINKDTVLLGCDSGGPNKNVYDSWIDLYRISGKKMKLLDSIKFGVTQIDGATIWKDYFFVTVHSGIDKCGYIIVGKIENKSLKIIKKVKCHDFPHGIIVHNHKLIYTSYGRSSINIHSLDEFIG